MIIANVSLRMIIFYNLKIKDILLKTITFIYLSCDSFSKFLITANNLKKIKSNYIYLYIYSELNYFS